VLLAVWFDEGFVLASPGLVFGSCDGSALLRIGGTAEAAVATRSVVAHRQASKIRY
jgi:hypothetical protein